MDLSSLGIRTMAEVNAQRRATPKHELPTKLDRAVEKKAADRKDEQQLAAWSLAVKVRDLWTCRKTGKRLKRTRQLDPLRAEAHHIVSRSDEAVRYDIRNGVALSYEVHEAVERNTLQIVGTRFFVKNGQKYINGNFPVRFKEIA